MIAIACLFPLQDQLSHLIDDFLKHFLLLDLTGEQGLSLDQSLLHVIDAIHQIVEARESLIPQKTQTVTF